MRSSRIVSLVAAGALLLVGQSVSATATVLPGEAFSGTDSWENSDCGYPLSVESSFQGRYSIRVGKNAAESAFFFHENITYSDVYTNQMTGESFEIRGHSTFQEVKATRIEGSVFEFTQVESGQPFVVLDSAGRVVARDRGSIRYHILVDTEGDDEPGGSFIDFLGADARGPHPGFSRTFCSYAGELVGISDSSQGYSLRPVGSTASPLGYTEYLPATYPEAGGSPLLVFLHGAGESGDGSAEQLGFMEWQGIPRFIANDGWPEDRPFVVLSPQHEIAGDVSWFDQCDGVEFPGSCGMGLQHDIGHPLPGSFCMTPTEVAAFIDYAVGAYQVDPNRVFLTGLSCGAFGAWEYLSVYGDAQVAAVVPVAGEGRPAWETAGCALGDAALWAFHGDVDDIVNPLGSSEPIAQVSGCPAPPRQDARYTEMPGVDHDHAGNYPYGISGPDIYSWMLELTPG
jgi:predicted esterase